MNHSKKPANETADQQLRMQGPLSEKDEEKQAESRTAKNAKQQQADKQKLNPDKNVKNK